MVKDDNDLLDFWTVERRTAGGGWQTVGIFPDEPAAMAEFLNQLDNPGGFKFFRLAQSHVHNVEER